MARSLTINHVEQPATSRLFNIFLLIAAAWLAMITLTGWAAEAPAAASVEARP